MWDDFFQIQQEYFLDIVTKHWMGRSIISMHHSRDKLVHLCGKEIGPKYSKENTIRLFFSDGTRCSSGVQLISWSSSELHDIVGDYTFRDLIHRGCPLNILLSPFYPCLKKLKTKQENLDLGWKLTMWSLDSILGPKEQLPKVGCWEPVW